MPLTRLTTRTTKMNQPKTVPGLVKVTGQTSRSSENHWYPVPGTENT